MLFWWTGNKLRLSLVLAVLSLGLCAYGEEGEEQGGLEQPGKDYPPVTVVQDPNLATVTDLMLGMGVTVPVYKSAAEAKKKGVPMINGRRNTFANNGNNNGFSLYSDVDLVPFEVGTAQAFLDGTGRFKNLDVPPEKKAILLLRYGFTDPRAVELLKKFKAAGAHSAVLVTDGNTSMNEEKASWPEDKNWTGDMKKSYLSGKQGDAIRDLIDDGGYKLMTPTTSRRTQPAVKPGDFFVTMSALHRNQTIGPIMHQKEVIMVVLKDPKKPVTPDNVERIFVNHGTGNWTRNHYNRTYFMEDGMHGEDGLGRNALAHALAVVDNFSKKGSDARIYKTETPNRFRQEAKDGTFWEVAYTDGNYELNFRLVRFFEDVARNPEKYKINQVTLSHFVFTNKNVLHSLFEAWSAMKRAGRPFKISGVLDEKFVGMRNFGIAAAMENYSPLSPFRRMTKGLGKEFADAVELNVFFKERPDSKNIDPDGYPSHRHLWHDKTSFVDFEELDGKGKPVGHFLEVLTGSYNLSNNKNNMERQDHMRVQANSPFAVSLTDSVMTARDAFRESGDAIRMEGAILVKVIADFVGHAPTDVPIPETKELVKLLTEREAYDEADVKKAEQILRDIHGKKESRLRSDFQVDEAEMETKLDIMARFLRWWNNLDPEAKGYKGRISAQEFVGLAIAMSESPYSVKSALTFLLWRPNVPRHKVLARAKAAYLEMGLKERFEAMGMEGDFPPDKVAGLPLVDLTYSDSQELKAYMKSGSPDQAAAMALRLARKSPEFAELTDKLLTKAEVTDRLTRMFHFVGWWNELPKKGYARRVQLQGWSLLNRMVTEDLALFLLKEKHEKALSETLNYFMRMRGYSSGDAKALVTQAEIMLGFKAAADYPHLEVPDMGDGLCPKTLKAIGNHHRYET